MDIIKAPEILLPQTDMNKWAVVACDQFTSEPKYWEDVAKLTEGAPSTYHMILPEAYLGKNNDKYISEINKNMFDYLNRDIFTKYDGFMLVERGTSNGIRLGLIVTVDLMQYDYTPLTFAPIKATEGTILNRIPPRVKIRENAPLDIPHIMLLCDDKKEILFEELYRMRESFEKVYDFELNMNGGHIRGYFIRDKQLVMNMLGQFDTFLVGDGNHSLAAAKECYLNNRTELNRYAMCELVNIYDRGLKFEPIHRVVFGANTEFINGLREISRNMEATRFIAEVQNYIEKSLKKGNIKDVDYIHGVDSVMAVVKASKDATEIFMPTIEKSELFPYILNVGVLPKKAFSMGEARDKRYYLESRKIK